MTNLLARLFNVAPQAHEREPVVDTRGPYEQSPNGVKTLRIEEALNGKVISFMRYKFNPNGPDERELVTYVVTNDESLLDGIATVLTVMEARNGK